MKLKVKESFTNPKKTNPNELVNTVLGWYDFDTNYIDDGGQRRTAEKKNQNTLEWFNEHPLEIKQKAYKIMLSKVHSSDKAKVQNAFGKLISEVSVTPKTNELKEMKNIKETIKSIIKEESEYEVFFRKALDKAGKKITDMSDDEKKAFFTKIDNAWTGKGEKNEGNTFGAERAKAIAKGDDSFEVDGKPFKVTGVDAKDKENAEKFTNETLVGGQKKLDVDGDGEIEASDLAALRAGKKADESINEEKYTVIDPKGNQMGASDKMQAVAIAKKKGGEKAGFFVVSNKNALKARRALEKFKGDFKNPKLKDMMADLFYESVEEASTSSAPGEWVAYLSMARGKKLLKTFDTARGAKMFLSKNVDKLLGGANVESVGIMTKKQWDEREAKYAIESVNELKKLPSGNFSIKVGYPTFADYEKKAKVGDTILKYDKRGGMIKTFVNGSELDKNAEKYLDTVNNITSGIVYLSKKGMKGVAQVPDYEKKEVGVLVLEAKSLSEAISDKDLPNWLFDDPIDFEDWYEGGMELANNKGKLAPFSSSDEKKLFQLVGMWQDAEGDYQFGRGDLGTGKTTGARSASYSAQDLIKKFLKQKGKVVKTEGNAFGAAVVAAKKAGEDEFKVDGKTFKVENELPKATIPAAVQAKLDMAIDKIKDTKLSYNQKLSLIGKVMDGLGVDKGEFNKMASKLKGTMEGKSVNEGNAFGMAVSAAKKEGLKEFEFNGKTYKVKKGAYEKNELAKKLAETEKWSVVENTHVVVSMAKNGYGTLMSGAVDMKEAEKLKKATTAPRGEELQVITVADAKNMKGKLIGGKTLK